MSKLDENAWKLWNDNYFDKRYPKVESCVEMDRQITQIKEDIIFIKSLSKHEMPDKPSAIMFFPSIARKSLAYLNNLVLRKENSFALADCRNVIETQRLDETAQVFSDSSKKAEDRILVSSKKKQYIYIAVGGATILTALILILRK